MVLRTLHFTNAWHAASGGIGTFYRALLDTANRAGWHARLVVPSEATRFEPVGASAGIYHISAPRAPFSPEYRVLYPHTYLLPNSPIREVLGREQPHLVEICDKFTLSFLGGLLRTGHFQKIAGRPAVVGLSCERVDETLAAYAGAGVFARRFGEAFMKCLYFPLFDHHVAVSRHVARELEPASRGHKVGRGVWIRGMGVDAQRFHPRRRNSEVRAELLSLASAPGDTMLLLYAGRLAPEKNLPLLRDLMTELGAGYRLLIAGNGPMRDEFLADCNRRVPGLVTYLGHVSDRDRLADLMANASAFLHPNPNEPYGIAPLEAMAAGVPLIAPDSGGVVTYANSDNAWIVPAISREFASAVRLVRDDPNARERKLQCARATAERLDWPEVSAGFMTLYSDIYERVRSPLSEGTEEPAFFSTPGNWLGWEISTRDSTVESQ